MKTIENKEQYLIALERFEEIFQANDSSSESDEADKLSLLIKAYEEQHYIIDSAPII